MNITQIKLEAAIEVIAKKFNTTKMTVIEAYLLGNKNVQTMVVKMLSHKVEQ